MIGCFWKGGLNGGLRGDMYACQSEQRGHFVWGAELAITPEATNAENSPVSYLKLRLVKGPWAGV